MKNAKLFEIQTFRDGNYNKCVFRITRGDDGYITNPTATFKWQSNLDSPDDWYGLGFIVPSGDYEDLRFTSNIAKQIVDWFAEHCCSIEPDECAEALTGLGYQRAVYIPKMSRFVRNSDISKDSAIFSIKLNGNEHVVERYVLSTYNKVNDLAQKLYDGKEINIEHVEDAAHYRVKTVRI